jgi:hypothetical protein
MGTDSRSKSGMRAILVLVGMFLGFTCIAAATMGNIASMSVGLVATPTYLATHYLAMALGRKILRARATVWRFLLSAIAAYLVYSILPVVGTFILSRDDPAWMDIVRVLAFVGTAVTVLTLMLCEDSSATIEPLQTYRPPTVGSSPSIYPVPNQHGYRPTYVQKADSHVSERESAR